MTGYCLWQCPSLKFGGPTCAQLEVSQVDAINQRIEGAFHFKGVTASGNLQVCLQPGTSGPGCVEGFVIACHIHCLHSMKSHASILLQEAHHSWHKPSRTDPASQTMRCGPTASSWGCGETSGCILNHDWHTMARFPALETAEGILMQKSKAGSWLPDSHIKADAPAAPSQCSRAIGTHGNTPYSLAAACLPQPSLGDFLPTQLLRFDAWYWIVTMLRAAHHRKGSSPAAPTRSHTWWVEYPDTQHLAIRLRYLAKSHRSLG